MLFEYIQIIMTSQFIYVHEYNKAEPVKILIYKLLAHNVNVIKLK